MGAVVIFILLALLWVVLILPRQREVRRHNALVASLDIGDEVMSGAGIYGTITAIGDDEVSLEIAPGVIIKMAKRAVGSRIEPADQLGDQLADATSDDHMTIDEPAADAAELNRSQIDRTED